MKRYKRSSREKGTALSRISQVPLLRSLPRRSLGIGLVLAVSLAAAPAAAAASPRSWQSYVLGPATTPVTAVRAEGRGAVTHPESLVRRHGKPTTLTTVAGRTPASVVLDFGTDVAGTPGLDVAAVSGPVTLSLVTGETRQYLRRPAATTTTVDAAAGAGQVTLAATAGLEAGNTITFAGAQPRTVNGFDPAARTVDLDRPLDQTVPAGTAVATTPGAPASDESRGLAGVGGPDTLAVTAPGPVAG